MKLFEHKKQQGFTLIELMVVIAIIAMLSSIILTSIGATRRKARDTKRVADLKQIDTAIQVYLIDNGHAPYVGTLNCQVGNNCSWVLSSDAGGAWTQLELDLRPYLAKLPKDPLNKGYCDGFNDCYYYEYIPPSQVFRLCSRCSPSILNQQYSILAQTMEVSSASNNVRGGTGYSIRRHTFGGDSF